MVVMSTMFLILDRNVTSVISMTNVFDALDDVTYKSP
jgi:hypothetical protein